MDYEPAAVQQTLTSTPVGWMAAPLLTLLVGYIAAVGGGAYRGCVGMALWRVLTHLRDCHCDLYLRLGGRLVIVSLARFTSESVSVSGVP